MKKHLIKKDENLNIAEKHLCKYIYDLQKHFGLSDIQILKILNNRCRLIKQNTQNKVCWKNFKNHLFELFQK